LVPVVDDVPNIQDCPLPITNGARGTDPQRDITPERLYRTHLLKKEEIRHARP